MRVREETNVLLILHRLGTLFGSFVYLSLFSNVLFSLDFFLSVLSSVFFSLLTQFLSYGGSCVRDCKDLRISLEE